MSEISVQGVYIERFKALSGEVIRPVPDGETLDYEHWRATHLGAVALNFVDKNPVLNTPKPNSTIMFAGYDQTAVGAADQAKRFRNANKTQFGLSHQARMKLLFELGGNFAYPVLVHSIANKKENFKRLVETDNSPAAYYIGAMTVDNLDEHSRLFLSEIFDLSYSEN